MKTIHIISLLALSAVVSACQANQVLADSSGPVAHATPYAQVQSRLVAPHNGHGYAPQVVLSPDARVNDALQAALPTVHAILAEHRCIRMGGLARLNPF
ncbi:MAG: hypothetical protein ACOVO0_04325, partial [Burkholderiaceae bacterium]